MRKTKEYSSDVQRKIVKLNKIDSDYKKIAKALEIPISTIRSVIINFQLTRNNTNLPGRGHVWTSRIDTWHRGF